MRAWPLLLCCTLTFPALAAEGLHFKGVRLGADQETLRQAILTSARTFICFATKEPDVEACSMEGLTYAQVPTRGVLATFRSGRLVSVYITFDRRAFDSVAAALRDQLGAPSLTLNGKPPPNAPKDARDISFTWKIKGQGIASVFHDVVRDDISHASIVAEAEAALMGKQEATRPRPKTDL